MNEKIINIVNVQAVAVALCSVLAAWPGSGSAGIMGTSKDGDSIESSNATSDCGSFFECMMQTLGIMGTGREDADGDDGEVSTLGIMGTGKDGDG